MFTTRLVKDRDFSYPKSIVTVFDYPPIVAKMDGGSPWLVPDFFGRMRHATH